MATIAVFMGIAIVSRCKYSEVRRIFCIISDFFCNLVVGNK